jgi:hypothetical protein
MVRRGIPPAKGQPMLGIKPFKIVFNWGKDRRRKRAQTPTDMVLIKCRRVRSDIDYELKLAVFGIYIHLKITPHKRAN